MKSPFKNNDERFSHTLLGEELDRFDRSQLTATNIYELIVETRKFEIENFWRRTLFFWGTLTITIVGYYSGKIDPKYLYFLSVLGLSYNVIFSLSLRGSKYWQEHWELLATYYESAMTFRLFKWHLQEEIKKNNLNVDVLLRPYRFSVSKLTMILSDVTVLFWIALLFKDLTYLNATGELSLVKCNLIGSCVLNLFAISVLLLPIFIGAYIGSFILNTIKANQEKSGSIDYSEGGENVVLDNQ